MITYVGLSGASRVSAGEKVRLTWDVDTSLLGEDLKLFGVFGTDTTKQATKIRDALPSVGLVPVSPVTASPGDLAFVFDVRLAQTWGYGTHTAAEVAAKIEGLPVSFVNLTRMRKVDLSLSAAELETQQVSDTQTAIQQAATQPSFLEGIVGKVGALTGVALAVVVLALGVYLYGQRK